MLSRLGYFIHQIFFFLTALTLTSNLTTGQIAKASKVSFSAYVDSTSMMTLNQIIKPTVQSKFRLLNSNEISCNITQASVWISFVIDDPSSTEQRYLEITCPNIQDVEFFFPRADNQYGNYKAGFLSDFETRPILIDLFTFPISPSPQTHFLRLRSSHFLNTRFEIRTLEELSRGAAIRELFFSLYGGLMLAIIAGVLFYIYLIRYCSYLFYIGYIIFISSVNLVEKGFYFQFLWPHAPETNFYFPLLPFGVSFCMLLFLKNIWDQSACVKMFYRFNFWIVTALPSIVVLHYLLHDNYQTAVLVTQTHSFVVCFNVIVASIVSYTRSSNERRRFFKFIIMGLCIFSLGVLIYLLSQNHVLPINSFTENAIMISSVIEVCFFTAALIFHSDTIYKRQKSLLLQK